MVLVEVNQHTAHCSNRNELLDSIDTTEVQKKQYAVRNTHNRLLVLSECQSLVIFHSLMASKLCHWSQ